MALKYNRNLIQRAKELREDMTMPERQLWYNFLSKYKVRFQRQKTIDNFIVELKPNQLQKLMVVDIIQMMEKCMMMKEQKCQKGTD